MYINICKDGHKTVSLVSQYEIVNTVHLLYKEPAVCIQHVLQNDTVLKSVTASKTGSTFGGRV